MAPVNTVMIIYSGNGLTGNILTFIKVTISNSSDNTVAYFTNNTIYLTSRTQYTFSISTGQNL